MVYLAFSVAFLVKNLVLTRLNYKGWSWIWVAFSISWAINVGLALKEI